jgi:hypothetical protein
LHGAVDFETVLVPYARRNCDLFLSCHLQSDPSCTYLESCGCGLPIIGYDNLMWAGMQERSHAGWVVPMGRPDAIVDRLVQLDRNRAEICAASDRALCFAAEHVFEAEFSRRLEHLARIAG